MTLNELKENSKLEKEELGTLYLIQSAELRNQMAVNERKFQEELVRREEIVEAIKKDYEGRLATQEIIKGRAKC